VSFFFYLILIPLLLLSSLLQLLVRDVPGIAAVAGVLFVVDAVACPYVPGFMLLASLLLPASLL
jgi:hypothetical protein